MKTQGHVTKCHLRFRDFEGGCDTCLRRPLFDVIGIQCQPNEVNLN